LLRKPKLYQSCSAEEEEEYLRQSGLYLISDMMYRDCSEITPNTLKFLRLTIRSNSTHTSTLQVTITILFTYCCKLSNSMEDSPSDANCSAIIHKIPCMLWTKVYHCAHNSPSFASIQYQANAFHSIPCYFIKIHFNIILPSRPRSSNSPPNSCVHFSSPCMP